MPLKVFILTNTFLLFEREHAKALYFVDPKGMFTQSCCINLFSLFYANF